MRSCWGSESVIFSDWNLIWACVSVLLFSFAAPETGALDCERCAPSGASSPRRNLRDHRSQLRLVGEATGYVDGIKLVVDFHRAAHLRLSVWHRAGRHTEAKELRDAFKEGTRQRHPATRDSLLSSVSFQQLSHAVKSIPTTWNLSQQRYLKHCCDRFDSALTEFVCCLWQNLFCSFVWAKNITNQWLCALSS